MTKYVLINGIDSWQNSESLSFIPTTNGSIPEYNSPTCLPMSTIAADNNVPTAMKALSVAQSQIWSFHLPLHRFVASCLREVSRRPYQRADEKPGGMDELLSSLRESEDARKLYRIYSGLIEYPAVILARNSQIRSELWLRNGKSMFDQVGTFNMIELHQTCEWLYLTLLPPLIGIKLWRTSFLQRSSGR